jgi:2-C-methyl-D-erythritol 4-phosphate cytidylyltransferase
MPADHSVAVIIPAAGSGSRFGDAQNKVFAVLAGKPLWVHCVERFAARREVSRIVLAISDADQDTFHQQRESLCLRDNITFCRGGSERSDSVAMALATLKDDDSVEWVAVHDAARPLVQDRDLTAVFEMAERTGAAILATPITGTVKRGLAGASGCSTVDRRELWMALTPQVFRHDVLRSAYARHRGYPVTDDAQLVEQSGQPVAIVHGASDNLKITFPEDLQLAEAILKRYGNR